MGWLRNYKQSLEANKVALGLTNAEVDEQKLVADNCINALQANFAAQTSAQAARAKANTQKKNAFASIRKKVRNIKTRDAYSPALGAGMGIVGKEKTIDKNTARPKIKVRKVPQGYAISYKLMAFFSGVKIFRQRPGEEKKLLGVDIHSPFIDKEPMVNGTQYSAIFLIGDNPVGQLSNVTVVEL